MQIQSKHGFNVLHFGLHLLEDGDIAPWQRFKLIELDLEYILSLVRKLIFRVSDTNQAVQLQKLARGLKFRV